MEQAQEQVIRLIMDHSHDHIGVAIGITKKRSTEIRKEVAKLFDDYKSVSQRMQAITETYRNEGELAFALYTLGTFVQKMSCPLHMGFLGIIIAGHDPEDDE